LSREDRIVAFVPLTNIKKKKKKKKEIKRNSVSYVANQSRMKLSIFIQGKGIRGAFSHNKLSLSPSTQTHKPAKKL